MRGVTENDDHRVPSRSRIESMQPGTAAAEQRAADCCLVRRRRRMVVVVPVSGTRSRWTNLPSCMSRCGVTAGVATYRTIEVPAAGLF
jgi:hypothetical protein